MSRPVPRMPDWIESTRLYLRLYRSGDGDLLLSAGERNRQHLSEFESGNTLLHLKDSDHAESVAQQFADEFASGKCYVLGIFDKGSDQWAGQVFVGPTNRDLPEYVIGFLADIDYEGKGYVSEAVLAVLRILFTTMGAHRVTGDCNERNTRSWKLMERCGFTREGHLRENRRNHDGSFHGDYLYAILRHEMKPITHAS